jgi:capsular polysaccharide export protein
VEAGLRKGAVPEAALEGLADIALLNIGAVEAIGLADEVWTITSTLGFEALIRGKPVTCLGMPFYAGRGLTRDLVARPLHRKDHDVSLAQLVHACLIGYPRYFDPRSGAALSPENAVALLSDGIEVPPVNRWMAALQRFLPFR